MLLYQAPPNQVTFYTLILCLFKTDYIVNLELFHISIFPVFHLRRRRFLIATNTLQFLNKMWPLGFAKGANLQHKPSPPLTILLCFTGKKIN